jgi:hypothetical protein
MHWDLAGIFSELNVLLLLGDFKGGSMKWQDLGAKPGDLSTFDGRIFSCVALRDGRVLSAGVTLILSIGMCWHIFRLPDSVCFPSLPELTETLQLVLYSLLYFPR